MKLRYLPLIWMVPALVAQPVPKLNSISREYLQRGTTNELELRGDNLADGTRFLVAGDRGVQAMLASSPKEPLMIESSGGGISSLQVKANDRAKVQLMIDLDAPPGSRELRIVSSNGVSNPVTINVGTLPEALANGANKSLETAQAIDLPVAISGTVVNSADIHHYKFKARKDQHVMLDTFAFRLGSPLDVSLAVLDKDGKELARNEDFSGLDSLIDFKAPSDGEYIAQLRDYRFQGGGDYRYRLMIGAVPHVYSVYPLGGQRGQQVQVAVRGQNMADVSTILLRLDSKSALGRQDLRASTPNGISNPFPFEVGDMPERLEQEPNQALDQSDPISIPSTVNGRIQAAKDWDAYRFRAENSQRIIFEAAASRYGSPLDALLTLRDGKGNVLARNDDAVGADARFEYEFKEAGEYYLLIEDLLGRGGSEYAYRISARIPKPSFNVNVLPDNPRIHREGHVPIRCEVARLTGFNGTVRVQCENLPPGLYAEPLLLSPSDPPSGYLILAATKDAPLGPVLLKIVASGLIDGKTVTRNAQISTGDRAVKSGYLTVLEAAPFEVQATTLMAAIEQDQKAQVEVVVQRRGEFSGDIKLSAEGFSAGREPLTKSFDAPTVIMKGTDTRAVLALKPRLDSEIGTRRVVIKAESTVNGQTITEYSMPIPVATSQIPFVLSTTLRRLSVTAVPPGSGSAAAEGVFIVKADRRAGFSGEIALNLQGLPEGITATTDKIPANGSEATIKLVATDKAPTGKEFPLSISGSGMFNDRQYKQQPDKVMLTINAPETMDTKPVPSSVPTAKNVGAQ